MSQTDLIAILPELMVAVGALIALIAGAFHARSGFVSAFMALILLVAGVLVAFTPDAHAFHGSFLVDGFARFAQVLVAGAALVCIVLADRFFAAAKQSRFELSVLIGLAALGMMVMIAAGDFLILYLGLELQSLALYVLAAFERGNRRSTEAGLKYFVLGALSSGLMLYGISLIYGFSGALSFSAVAVAVKAGLNLGLVFGLVFLIAGFAFKLSAVPFHMWAPDVYEGAPTPVTAFFATAAKVAALAMTLRVLITAFPDALMQWRQIIIFASVLSMILGAFAGIAQTNIKRLMAYSAIGHMGYALLGLAAGTLIGVSGALTYLAFYVIANLGTFACIQTMRRDGVPVETIADLAGLSRSRPKLAFALSALVLSLAGLPPLMGIFANLYVFLAAIGAGLYIAALIGILSSCV
ncbi:MAG: NADH-quinone oxidoreductase subunit NuoN, partial [Rhizomicrobium sp.]